MKKWAGSVARAVGMGVAWALAWGVVGVLVSLVVDPDGAMDEPWVLIGAYPGFVAGLIFFALAANFARGRSPEPSLSRAGVLGAAAGVVPGLFPFGVVAAMTSRADYPSGLLAVMTVGATTLVSVLLGVGWALLRARRPAASAQVPT